MIKPFDKAKAWRPFIEKACTDQTGSAPRKVVDWMCNHLAAQGKRVLTYAQADELKALGFKGERADCFIINQNAARMFHVEYTLREARKAREDGRDPVLIFMCTADARTCDAAKAISRTVFEIDWPPDLPLTGCDAAAPCRCMLMSVARRSAHLFTGS